MTNKKKEPEKIDLGPIHIERIGRVIKIGTSWNENQYKKFIEGMRNKRPELKKEIDEKINELFNIVQMYDSLELLAPISTINLTSDSETYTEITHEGSEPIVEYLLSIITSIPFPKDAKKSTPDIIKKTIDILKDIQNKIRWYYNSEVSEGKYSKEEAEIRFKLINYGTTVRGSSFPQHVEKTFLELFSSHDKFLADNFGFSSEDFLKFIKKIIGQLEYNINNTRDNNLKPLKEAFEEFQEYIKSHQGTEIEKLIESFKAENKGLTEKCQVSKEYLDNMGGSKVFEIKADNDIENKILKYISLTPGENSNFIGIKNFKGWLLNPSLIYEKPIVLTNDTFFCFHPQVLFRNIVFILETLIKNVDEKYYRAFLKSRDKYLEEKSIELISNILRVDNSKVYRNLKYTGGELDGLIEYDDVLLLIEAKAGKLSESAKRGSIEAFVNDMKDDLLGYAFQQGEQALNYIKKSQEAKFVDKHGNVILTLNKNNYKHFFIISLYFEPIGHMVTNISLMKRLGIVSNEKHWAVYLNDLRVISEIIDFPSQFIHYLTRRLESNKIQQLHFFDEMDNFMLYLKSNLYFEGIPEENLSLQFVGYTEELDNYYSHLEGRRNKVEKPSQKMPKYFKTFIEKIELRRPKHFIMALIDLLNCNEETRNKISEQIERCELEYEKDKKPHSARLCFQKNMIVLLVNTKSISQLRNQLDVSVKEYFKDKNIERIIIIFWIPKIQNTKNDVNILLYER